MKIKAPEGVQVKSEPSTSAPDLPDLPSDLPETVPAAILMAPAAAGVSSTIYKNAAAVVANGNSNSSGGDGNSCDPFDFEDELQAAPPAKKRKRISAGATAAAAAAKVKDVRTRCDVCAQEGSNENLVRCDVCKKCFHFSCLLPPVKKSPKVAGYSWHCNDCDPSDRDSDWHLD